MTLALRVRLVLLAIASIFVTMLAWNAAQGQIRPPRPGFNPGMRPPGSIGGMRPPGGIGGGGIGMSWRCPKCGQTGPGTIPPQTCPGCGVRFVNGVGNGSAGGIRGNPSVAPRNPGINTPTINRNPPRVGSGTPPVNQPPAANPSGGDGETEIVPLVDESEEQPLPSSRNTVLIALVIGVILVGIVVLACGAFLVFHNMKNGDSHAKRRRRRLRDEYDD